MRVRLAPIARAAFVLATSQLSCQRPPLGANEVGAPKGTMDANAATVDGGFVAVSPCDRTEDYVSEVTTIAFGFLGPSAGFAYDPKCLRVARDTTVTFVGDFHAHPLYPSTRRGTGANPIPGVGTGSSKDVEFSNAGFFGYYCGIHGALDDGSAMAGTVWVE